MVHIDMHILYLQFNVPTSKPKKVIDGDFNTVSQETFAWRKITVII